MVGFALARLGIAPFQATPRGWARFSRPKFVAARLSTLNSLYATGNKAAIICWLGQERNSFISSCQ